MSARMGHLAWWLIGLAGCDEEPRFPCALAADHAFTAVVEDYRFVETASARIRGGGTFAPGDTVALHIALEPAFRMPDHLDTVLVSVTAFGPPGTDASASFADEPESQWAVGGRVESETVRMEVTGEGQVVGLGAGGLIERAKDGTYIRCLSLRATVGESAFYIGDEIPDVPIRGGVPFEDLHFRIIAAELPNR